MQTLKFIDGELTYSNPGAVEEISLEAWRAGVRPEAGGFALVLPNDASVDDVGPEANEFSAIVLTFPSFRDGRAYTQARLLRERFGYRGEIRARGDILRDQIAFMARCGIDSFEIDADAAASLIGAFGDFSHVYQAAADGAAPVWRRRARRALAAE